MLKYRLFCDLLFKSSTTAIPHVINSPSSGNAVNSTKTLDNTLPLDLKSKKRTMLIATFDSNDLPQGYRNIGVKER